MDPKLEGEGQDLDGEGYKEAPTTEEATARVEDMMGHLGEGSGEHKAATEDDTHAQAYTRTYPQPYIHMHP